MKKKGISLDTADPKQSKKIRKHRQGRCGFVRHEGLCRHKHGRCRSRRQGHQGGRVSLFPEQDGDSLFYLLDVRGSGSGKPRKVVERTSTGTVEKIRFIIFRHIDHYATHEYAAKTLLNEAYCLPPKYFRQVKEREKHYFGIVARVLSEYLGSRAEQGYCHGAHIYPVRHDELDLLLVRPEKTSQAEGVVQPHLRNFRKRGKRGDALKERWSCACSQGPQSWGGEISGGAGGA